MIDNETPCALIGDLVHSRRVPDQLALLEDWTESLEWVNSEVRALQPLTPTVGDEFQGVYRHWSGAFRASLLLSLRLKGRVEVRFGFGIGPIERLESREKTQSGAGWWRAREAIEATVDLEGRKGWPSSLRSRIETDDSEEEGLLNAFLICRDQILYQMDEKDARIALGLYQGDLQTDVADSIGVNQPTVSARQRSRGPAALVKAHASLRDLDREAGTG